MVRAGFRALLEREPGYEVVGEHEDAREAIREIKKLRPDLAILDITMPGLSGVDAVEPLKQASPRTRVLMASSHQGAHFVQQALQGRRRWLHRQELQAGRAGARDRFDSRGRVLRVAEGCERAGGPDEGNRRRDARHATRQADEPRERGLPAPGGRKGQQGSGSHAARLAEHREEAPRESAAEARLPFRRGDGPTGDSRGAVEPLKSGCPRVAFAAVGRPSVGLRTLATRRLPQGASYKRPRFS